MNLKPNIITTIITSFQILRYLRIMVHPMFYSLRLKEFDLLHVLLEMLSLPGAGMYGDKDVILAQKEFTF